MKTLGKIATVAFALSALGCGADKCEKLADQLGEAGLNMAKSMGGEGLKEAMVAQCQAALKANPKFEEDLDCMIAAGEDMEKLKECDSKSKTR